MVKKKIGILSLIPDPGHVLPLLRIAKIFASHQYEIICYLPDECRKLADSFQLSMKSVGITVTGLNPGVFTLISEKSLFYYWNHGYKVLARDYFEPLRHQIAVRFQYIREMVGQDSLSFLIVDNHEFNEWYINIAQWVNIPVALHASEGNLRYTFHPFAHSFGLHWPLSLRIYHHFIIQPIDRITRTGEALVRKLTKNSGKQGVPTLPHPVFYISSGLGFLEKEIVNRKYIKHMIKPAHYVHFPPVKDRRNIPLKSDLKQWLDDSKGKPVVYVSFGTMVKPSQRVLKAILSGLMTLDLRILWVASKEQQAFLKSNGNSPDLRVEEYVPQPQVLADENIRYFITHGGAGGVQESLLAGKPMLCIPFAFDQPYNSSMVALLNVGIRLDKNKVTARSIRQAMIELTHNPHYRESARGIRGIFLENDGGDAICNYLREKILPE